MNVPPRPFTCFDAMTIFGAPIGAAMGFACGADSGGGWTVAIPGLVLGALAGWLLARLPLALVLLHIRYEIRRATTSELFDRLRREYWLYREILPELMTRSVDLAPALPLLLASLEADFADERRFAVGAVHLAFPELLPTLDGYDPHAETTSCRARVQALRAHLARGHAPRPGTGVVASDGQDT